MMIQFINYRIETEMQIEQIQDISIEHELNSHARLRIKGLLASQENIDQTMEEYSFIAYNGDNEILFCGGTVTISVERTDLDLLLFELTALSHTRELDIEQRVRTFQDLDMSYSDVLKEILNAYQPRGDFISTVDTDQKIPHMLVQYHETDWQFIQRLASRFHTSVLVECRQFSSRFYFGLPDRPVIKEMDYTAQQYSLGKDIGQHAEVAYNHYPENIGLDGTVYEFRSYQDFDQYRPGDLLAVGKIPAIIGRVVLKVENALPVCTYTVLDKNQAGLPYRNNRKIAGAKLYGIIKEIRLNTMRVDFDVDRRYAYSGRNNTYIPYSGEENNGLGFYLSIPGSRVEVLFPDFEERSCFVSAAVRTKDRGVERMIPSEKHLRNDYGKELMLGADQLDIIADNAVSVQMMKNGMVSIKARDIMLQAGQSLTVGAQRNTGTDVPWITFPSCVPRSITISAENRITLTDGTGVDSIVMNENCEIICDAITRVDTAGEPRPIAAGQPLPVSSGENEDRKVRSIRNEPEETLLQKKAKENAKLSELQTTVFSLAATGFVVDETDVGSEFREFSATRVKALTGIESKIRMGNEMAYNPIKDGLLGGNERLFAAISYGENKNKK